ncbi:MAG TPA: quinol:electron acceptor oxidoreductase subunit ActD [Candidatus Kryptonia bacterium]
MSERKLYGITALFNEPGKVLAASKAVAGEGYKKFDTYTPYPIHGLDNAMKLKPSRIGVVTFVLSMIGVVSLLLFTWWTNSVDYPLWVGGKPYFAWPSYVPLMFEMGVLFSAVSTVIALLAIWLGLPRNSHPLQDTEFLKRVSDDSFGVCIEAADPKFDERKTRALLESLGALKVEIAFYDVKTISLKEAVLDPKFIAAIIIVAIASSGAAYFGLNKMLLMRPWSSLNDQEKVNPETRSAFYQDGFGMRPPVDGTVARNQMPYEFTNDLVSAGKYIKNPILPTSHVMEVGQRDFNTYCSPCHGYFAEGDSRLQGQFPNPPSLQSDSLRLAPDGLFYEVITNGYQGVMPAYSRQIPRDERWAIIWYIRALQKANHAEGASTK